MSEWTKEEIESFSCDSICKIKWSPCGVTSPSLGIPGFDVTFRICDSLRLRVTKKQKTKKTQNKTWKLCLSAFSDKTVVWPNVSKIFQQKSQFTEGNGHEMWNVKETHLLLVVVTFSLHQCYLGEHWPENKSVILSLFVVKNGAAVYI